MDNRPILTEQQREVPQLRWVDSYSRLLDSKFRIPGTDIRFGVDFLLGLIPGAGDLTSLAMSGLLIVTMAKHGASPRLAARMLFNVGLDALVGTVPILGNLFDLVFKANYRNAVLMREYYDEGRHTGSVWPVILMVLGGIFLIFFLTIWAVIALFSWLLGG
ncbi:DUF4112 domain-containing protein [Neolewinella lacunae]|uniref:DUF4112 domain-containing protein n=1 Tax=Neolewinella lacunae TaxID=1517758 RepID=A0A923PNR6_9BACT|nr:DUF4112 domain-containing protein [Neolewinella lacunae]MBC6996839.1 DUF4112 domain-containing protein [Neolewinella lacunae]MDN3633817.1 DUF4112 domain-containing protein [Neolewinella lacunae]